MRTTISALVAGAALSFAAPALADTTYSSNWSGYAVHAPGVSYREVSGSWRQPDVTCTRGSQSYSAYWVGLGGYSETSNALEQIGTEADCSASGTPVLSVWYELVPAASVPIEIPIQPGDAITATVAVTGHRVVLTFLDATLGRSFTKALTAGPIDVSSAEWIVEAPSDCLGSYSCRILPLANFGSASFTGAQVQEANGKLGTLLNPAWDATRVILSPSGRRLVSLGGGSTGQPAAMPAVLRPPGNSFKITFSRVGPAEQEQFDSRRLLASVAVPDRRPDGVEAGGG